MCSNVGIFWDCFLIFLEIPYFEKINIHIRERLPVIQALIISNHITCLGACSSVVVKALCYKPEGCGFKSQ
jgi:hypothetical protein